MSIFSLQDRFRWACEHLLAKGIKPTPTELEKFDSRFVNRDGTNISLAHGRFTKIRRQEFIKAGWIFISDKGRFQNGRWEPHPDE